MDFGAILKRAWDILRENWWLILLGVIVVLGSGGSSGNGGGGSPGSPSNFDQFQEPKEGEFDFGDFGDFDFEEFDTPEDFNPEEIFAALGIGAAILIPLCCIVLAIVIGFWAAAMIARGGLVAGVDSIEKGEPTSFGDAWRAGWAKGWRLMGIGLIPAIPGMVTGIVGLALVGGIVAMAAGGTIEDVIAVAGIGMVITIIVVACVAFIASLILNFLRLFAERAAMLEDTGVFESYSRGWNVMRENLGPALILFVIQVGISIALGIALLVPSMIMALCCFLWPVLLAIKGAVEAYFSTVWTLAWREWLGMESSGGIKEPVEPAPAV